MLFGSTRDFDILVNISRELLGDIIEQEILYYKISLTDTQPDIYGESQERFYWSPVKFNCLITRGDQIVGIEEVGPDLNREASFAFIRQDLVDNAIVPEVGDIVMWHEDYYEVDTVRENQLFVGRDKSYNLSSYGPGFGSSVSIIVDTHMTRLSKIDIIKDRL